MTSIDESLTAKGFTPAASVQAVFGAPRTIDGIVIHHWGLTGQTHDGVVDFFVNGPGATSAHFVASAGRINCLVNPADAAWHCPGKNASTIGIECRPEATDEDYATVAELVRTLRSQHGNLPLSRHRDWYATACPGVWDLDRIDILAGGIAAQGSVTPQSTPTPVVTESEEDFMGGKIDAQQAEDIVQAVTERVLAGILPLLDNKVRINAIQAESIVQATTARTTAAVDALNTGKQIDRGQADDIARAAALYGKES